MTRGRKYPIHPDVEDDESIMASCGLGERERVQSEVPYWAISLELPPCLKAEFAHPLIRR